MKKPSSKGIFILYDYRIYNIVPWLYVVGWLTLTWLTKRWKNKKKDKSPLENKTELKSVVTLFHIKPEDVIEGSNRRQSTNSKDSIESIR